MIDPAGIEHIETFNKGDPVPEWLVSVDPTKRQTVGIVLRFTSATAVVKAWGEFWLIPEDTGAKSFIHADGNGGSFSIHATETPIVMPMGLHIMGRPGGFAMRYNEGGWEAME